MSINFVENLNRYENLMGEEIESYVDYGEFRIFLSNAAFIFGKRESLSAAERHGIWEKLERRQPVVRSTGTQYNGQGNVQLVRD